MGALVENTDYEIVGVQRGDIYNEIVIRTINTVDSGDTMAIDMTKYGINATGLLAVRGDVQATANSVVAQHDPTCTVSSGTITLTTTSGTNTQSVYRILGFADTNPSSAL